MVWASMQEIMPWQYAGMTVTLVILSDAHFTYQMDLLKSLIVWTYASQNSK
jgi:hypothetical protein